MLDGALREAAAGDDLRAPLLQRHYARHEPVQELGLLLGIRSIRRLPRQPSALHPSLREAVVRRIGRICG